VPSKKKLKGPIGRVIGKARTATRLVKEHGVRGTIVVVGRSAALRWYKHKIHLAVNLDDAVNVDWTEIPDRIAKPLTVKGGPINIAWIMSPPGPESGGHQNIFRFIKFAEDAGHTCTVYFYQPTGRADVDGLREIIESSDAYADVNAELRNYDRDLGLAPDTQAVFATGWETAYPSFLDKTNAKRFYFIQDFEPLFYPTGSDALLAENTYRFGFHGITAGAWLSTTVREKFGMKADHFEFAVDKSLYNVTNTGPRNEVFFYARPVTARRAYEFGLLVLSDFARLRPDVTINLAGWDVSNWEIPFPHVNLSSMSLSQLNAVYNRCAAGLVLSLTNMSLLPLELISAGVTPVVNDGPNNRLVSDNPYIEYVPASPMVIAKKMVEVLERPDAVERSNEMSSSVANVNWTDSGTQFVDALERAMRG
jgi:hypothetical protein